MPNFGGFTFAVASDLDFNHRIELSSSELSSAAGLAEQSRGLAALCHLEEYFCPFLVHLSLPA